MGHAVFCWICWYFFNEIPRTQPKYLSSRQSIRNFTHSVTSIYIGEENRWWRQDDERILGKINWQRQTLREKTWKEIWGVTTTPGQTGFGRETASRKVGKEREEIGWGESYQSGVRGIRTGFFKLICVWNKAITQRNW